MTSEHNAKKKEMSNQGACDKIIETPQMKAIREKALQSLNTKNKSLLLPQASCTKIAGNKTKISLRNFPSKLKVDKSVASWDKNDNEGIPQTRFRGKFDQRSSNTFSLSKPSRKDVMIKKQNQNTADQKSTKIWEKKDKNIGHQEIITRNTHDIEQHNKNQNVQESCNQNSSKCNCINVFNYYCHYREVKLILYLGKKGGKSFLKKNLAQERMQKLRTNLNVDKEKIKEMCNADLISKKSSQKLSRSSSNSSRYII